MSHRRRFAFVALLLVLLPAGLFAQKRTYSPPPPPRYPTRSNSQRPSMISRPAPSPRITTLLRNRPNTAVRSTRPLLSNRGLSTSRPPLRLAPRAKLAGRSSQLTKGQAPKNALKASSAPRQANFTIPKLTTAQRTNMNSRLSGLRGRLMASSAASNAASGRRRAPSSGTNGGGSEEPPASGYRAANDNAKSLAPGVPVHWTKIPDNKNKGGYKIADPKNPAYNYVRVRPDGTMVQVKNGHPLDKNGNPILGGSKTPEAHFPASDFTFHP